MGFNSGFKGLILKLNFKRTVLNVKLVQLAQKKRPVEGASRLAERLSAS